MRDVDGARGSMAYAVARWDVLVRTTVLLGVPAPTARRLAARAVTRAVAVLDRDDAGRDPDVELFAALLDTHRSDRVAWWRDAPSAADLVEAEAVAPVRPMLDRLSPDDRARVVLEAAALLAPEQVDEVVPPAAVSPAAAPPEPGLVEAVARVARTLVVAPPPPVRDWPVDRSSTGRGRAVTVTSIALALLLVGLLGWSATRAATGVPVAAVPLPVDEGDGRVVGSVDSVAPGPDGVPIAWYAGGVLRLPTRDVALASVVALDALPDGVVATTADGRVVVVDDSGTVTVLGEVEPGAEVVASSRTGVVAYIGAMAAPAASLPSEPRAVTVYDTRLEAVLARVPVDSVAEVVAVNDAATYVNDGDGHLVAGLSGEARRTNGVTVLDAASGAIAIAPAPGEVRVLRPGNEVVLSTGGDAVDLSSDGLYAVVRRTDPVLGLFVVDLTTQRILALPVEDGDTVTDAAFAADALVLVVRGPGEPPGPGRDDPDTTPRRSDLVTCALPELSCVRSVRLGGASTGPLLAR